MCRKVLLTVSLILLSLTAAVLHITAFAETGEDTAYVSITESDAVNGVYTLNFDVTSDKLRSVQFVFSYDNTVIVPCALDGTALEISTAEQSEASACFTPAEGFNLLPPEYIVNQARTTVNISLSTESDSLDYSTRKTVCGFTYKVADGKSKAASSLRLENAELPDSALSAVFPTELTASPIKIDNASKILYLSDDNLVGAVLSEFTFGYEISEYKVKGCLVTVRADGFNPIVDAETGYSNLAVMNIYTSQEKTQLVKSVPLEKADTDTGNVDFSFAVPQGAYHAEVIKNGYLTYELDFTASDTEIDLGDVELVPGDIMNSYSDVHGDGVVDIDDFVRVLRGFTDESAKRYRQTVDINEDGIVSVMDLSEIKNNLSN